MHDTPLTRQAAGAAWFSAFEIACRYGAQFVVTLVLARLLQPADFGLIAMLVVFTSFGALLVDAGFGTALIQRRDITASDETTVFCFSVCAGTLTGAALWLGAPAIATFYDEPSLVALARAIAFVLPLNALGAVPDALLTRRLDFKSRTHAEIVATTMSATLAIILAARGFGVWSFIAQALASAALRSAMLWQRSHWRPRGALNAASFRALFGFGGFMLLAGLLDTLSLRLQSLLIGKMFDARTLGYYALAQNTQQAPTSFIGGILNRVGLPVFSVVAHQPAKLVGALRLSLRTALFLFIPCMIGIAVTAKPLIDALYGPRWDSAAPILSILALSTALWPLHVLNLAALSAQGRSDLYFRLEVVKKLISIGLIVACSPWGPRAIAGAVLAASLVSVAVNTWYSKKFLGYGMVAQLADQRGTLALAAAAAVVGWAILHWNKPSLFATVAAIVLAAGIYLGGAVLARNAAWTELVLLLRALRKPGRPIPQDLL